MQDPRAFFQTSFHASPAVLASAPGRIEFIGNHLDYNGGYVLGAAIDRRMVVALGLRPDRRIRLVSSSATARVEVDATGLAPLTGPQAWANYPLGVYEALRLDRGEEVPGFDLSVTSTLPSGAGLSSSAAFELATAVALSAALGWAVDRTRLAKLCRRAENTFVGVPCGLLDQGVSAFGQRRRLVGIDCRTETFSTLPIPEDTAFWVFNTHHQHALTESLYEQRHDECARALSRLQTVYPQAEALVDLTPDQVREARAILPDPLWKRAYHITTEQERVNETKRALNATDLPAVGRALTASHASSRAYFENSTPEQDELVDLLVQHAEVYGARLTGGGFGGAVMAFTTDRFDGEASNRIALDYHRRFGRSPDVFRFETDEGARLEPA